MTRCLSLFCSCSRFGEKARVEKEQSRSCCFSGTRRRRKHEQRSAPCFLLLFRSLSFFFLLSLSALSLSHRNPSTWWTFAPWKVAGGSTQGVKTSTSSPSSRRPLMRLAKRILIPETCEKGEGSVFFFFFRGLEVRQKKILIPFCPSSPLRNFFESDHSALSLSLTDKDGDLPGRGGELCGGLDRSGGLGVEGDGLRSFFFFFCCC